MDISEIIGKGKVFEPPFIFNDKCIRDKNGIVLLNFDSNRCYNLDAWTQDCIVAEHIVELLNERWKDEMRK